MSEKSVQVRVPVGAREALEGQGVKAGDVLSAVAALPPRDVARLLAGDTRSMDAVTSPVSPSPVRAVSPVDTVSRPVSRAEARAVASRNAVRVATLSAGCVGVASGVLSVRATAAFAVSQGVTPDDWTRFLFPVALEGSMMAAAVVLWSRHGNRALAWAWMIVATGLAIAANVAHNPAVSTAGAWFSAVPPVAAFVMVEIVSSLRDRHLSAPKVRSVRVRLEAIEGWFPRGARLTRRRSTAATV